MRKPKQFSKFRNNPDNIDLLEELESAMSSIESAMESLAGYEEFKDWFDTLDDMWEEMNSRREEYEAIDVAEYAKEIEGLNRQYLRSVL